MSVRICKRWERVVVARPNLDCEPDIDQQISSARAIEAVVRPLAVRGAWVLHDALPDAVHPWTISHMPTGRALGGCATRAIGLRVLRMLPWEAGSGLGFGGWAEPDAELLAIRPVYDALMRWNEAAKAR